MATPFGPVLSSEDQPSDLSTQRLVHRQIAFADAEPGGARAVLWGSKCAALQHLRNAPNVPTSLEQG